MLFPKLKRNPLDKLIPLLLGLIIGQILFSSSLFALEIDQELAIILLGEKPADAIVNDPGFTVDDASMDKIWHSILANSKPKLQPSYEQMSMTRAWVEIAKIPNACMLNKIKNSSRETQVIFSDYPFTIFPPVRLITLKKNSHKVSQPFSMQSLKQGKIKVGVAKSRSYGHDIDGFIALNSQYFYVRGAEDSMSKLIDMLLKERVDAIIDFTQVVSTHLEGTDSLNATISLPIQEAGNPILAYITCTKSPQGQAVINAINTSYQTNAVKQSFQHFHYHYFGKKELSLLQPIIDDIFLSPHTEKLSVH
jgi:uncharacterized protein (TIGR02285 family)